MTFGLRSHGVLVFLLWRIFSRCGFTDIKRFRGIAVYTVCCPWVYVVGPSALLSPFSTLRTHKLARDPWLPFVTCATPLEGEQISGERCLHAACTSDDTGKIRLLAPSFRELAFERDEIRYSAVKPPARRIVACAERRLHLAVQRAGSSVQPPRGGRARWSALLHVLTSKKRTPAGQEGTPHRAGARQAVQEPGTRRRGLGDARRGSRVPVLIGRIVRAALGDHGPGQVQELARRGTAGHFGGLACST